MGQGASRTWARSDRGVPADSFGIDGDTPDLILVGVEDVGGRRFDESQVLFGFLFGVPSEVRSEHLGFIDADGDYESDHGLLILRPGLR
jgi:hypothetical protein